ncbi:hypothetical protein E0K83_01665 [Gramella sp. BOM4]|nr:hypothetical protein [Christiangramia bathymodioli]
MKKKDQTWSREELEIYVLLLCSDADFVQTPTELQFISTRVEGGSFDRIYNEYLHDSEDERIRKIKYAVDHQQLTRSDVEVLKKEIHELFLSNGHISESEKQLEDLLNDILG